MDAFPHQDSSDRTCLPPPGSFVTDERGGWSCPYCIMTPPHLRSPGSYSQHPPSNEYVDQHFSVCMELNRNPTWTQQRHGHASENSPYIPPAPFQTHHVQPSSGWHSTPTSSTAFYRPSNQYFDAPAATGHPTMYGYPSPQAPLPHPTYMASPPPQYHHYNHHSPQPSPQDSIAGSMVSPSVRSIDHGQVTDFLEAESSRWAQSEPDEEQVVMLEDKNILSEYFYYLNRQLKICRFAEEDRKTRGGKRDNLELGYGGIACRHCIHESGARKFFWSKADRLANSFAEISGHIMKCRNCPERTKNALKELKLHHPEQMAKMPRGSQKVFFRRVWRRLHPNQEDGSVATGSSTAPIPARFPHSQEQQDESNQLRDTNRRDSEAYEEPTMSPHVSLAIREDRQWLSDLDCAVRCCLEVFCATEQDVADQTLPIRVDQVGLRCLYCASKDRAKKASAMFPFSVSSIYDNAREFHRLHLSKCTNIPDSIRTNLSTKESSKTLSSMSRRYYLVAARSLGLQDTADGIRWPGLQRSIASLDVAELRAETSPGEGGIASATAENATVYPSGHFVQAPPFDEVHGSHKRRSMSPSWQQAEDDSGWKKSKYD